MESRIKGRLLSIIVAAAMIASTSTALAATTAPTPKPTAKITAKATKKPVAKKPSPKWPPSGFINPSHGEIFYKIPKANELLGVLSAAAALSQQITRCTKVACGVVTLASSKGCTWWNITSTVYGPLSSTDSSLVPYGTLQTAANKTKSKQITTVFLISTEPLKKNVNVGSLNISCHHDPVTASPQKVPSNIYTVNTPTPTPTDVTTANTN